MAPIEGVIQVQGDITNARTAEVVRTEVLLFILLTDVMFFPPLRNTLVSVEFENDINSFMGNANKCP